MPFTFFDSAQLPTMPWKNGGGLTREICCYPAGSSVQYFHWRLSIAEIAASGPFSAFAGFDRTITLLEGAGVRLHSANGGVDHLLNQALVPFVFSGDVALDCDVLQGPCQDFNVMVRRSFGSAVVHLQQQACTLAPSGALLVRQGKWRVHLPDGSVQLLEACGQDGAHWSNLAGSARAEPLSADAHLLAVQITAQAADGETLR